MTAWSDVVDGASTDAFTNAGVSIVGGTTQSSVFCFMPIARAGEDWDGEKAFPLTTYRTRTSCYVRGVKENVSIETNSAVTWRWRRIVFESIGNPLQEINLPNNASYFRTTQTAGYKRLVANAPANAAALYVLLFRGENQDDWVDPQIAVLDRKRIKIHMDRKFTLNSGFVGGLTKSYQFWHGINKTLNYDDREEGFFKTTSVFASETPNNCGDFYIVDIITPGFSAISEDTFTFTPNCTYYWYEK